MDLNSYRDLCHAASVDAGWWKEEDQVRTLLPPDLANKAVGWLHATKIALIHSEASEMMEGRRKGVADDHLKHRSMEEVEAADLLIRIFDYAGRRNLDLESAVREKMAYNAQRADHKIENREKAGGKAF